MKLGSYTIVSVHEYHKSKTLWEKKRKKKKVIAFPSLTPYIVSDNKHHRTEQCVPNIQKEIILSSLVV